MRPKKRLHMCLPSGQSAGGGARTRDRRVPADFTADSLATVPPVGDTGGVRRYEDGVGLKFRKRSESGLNTAQDGLVF
ncbi:hypothetical protein PoB_001778600 [Plakobranchus ocellatus]|uniref:Uncharacterized protein n=1 Tax=Plakobranchus ocellatus TaxID=259542 RepID=A0AAV3YVZ2_9GAST|nr:hypothetical protein PoB_001778600 [Plakobranchus ocellatus]